MKALNWFQAKALARLERRAVRRQNWRKWLFFRGHNWIISEELNGKETLRFVQNYDFGPGEFLAKDYTDEVWEGGTYPPCTEPGPAEKLPPSDTGGAGTFTETDFCGGYGNGGSVPPRTGPGITEPLPVETAMVANSSAIELSPLTPDGAGCWVTPPPNFYLVFAASAGIVGTASTHFQWSTAGASLAGALEYGADHPNADGSAGDPGGYAFGAEDFGELWLAVRSPGAIAYVPGATITGRVDILLESGVVLTEFATLTLPDNCA